MSNEPIKTVEAKEFLLDGFDEARCDYPKTLFTFDTCVEAMNQYASQQTAELQRDVESLRQSLTILNNHVKRLTVDMPEVCYVNPLLLTLIEEAEQALKDKT